MHSSARPAAAREQTAPTHARRGAATRANACPHSVHAPKQRQGGPTHLHASPHIPSVHARAHAHATPMQVASRPRRGPHLAAHVLCLRHSPARSPQRSTAARVQVPPNHTQELVRQRGQPVLALPWLVDAAATAAAAAIHA